MPCFAIKIRESGTNQTEPKPAQTTPQNNADANTRTINIYFASACRGTGPTHVLRLRVYSALDTRM